MRHTVRRPPRPTEQAVAAGPVARRTVADADISGAAPKATPVLCVLTTTRIPHKVPERAADSGP
ncbi:hypothetical protein DIZ27_28630 [Streptomyces sp. NWU339]|nr:hypothetical protein DIZ27_28630 [Streptomyces sp. NWU339]